jgi:hypothetical protein
MHRPHLPALLAASLLLYGAAVGAAPVVVTAGQVTIGYDPAGFSLTSTLGPGDLDSVAVLAIPNGLQFSFRNAALAAADSAYDPGNGQASAVDFLALLDFAALPGRQITGYTLTTTGSYATENPGTAEFRVGGVIRTLQAEPGGPFTFTDVFTGATPPALSLGVAARGNVVLVEILDGFDTVQTGTRSVLDFCVDDSDPATCVYREEPVFADVPRYRYEPDPGLASVIVNTVRLEATVVPLPGGLPLLVTAVAGLAWRWRARRGGPGVAAHPDR